MHNFRAGEGWSCSRVLTSQALIPNSVHNTRAGMEEGGGGREREGRRRGKQGVRERWRGGGGRKEGKQERERGK